MKARNFVAKHLHLNRPAVEQDRKKEEKKRGPAGRFFDEEQPDLFEYQEGQSFGQEESENEIL